MNKHIEQLLNYQPTKPELLNPADPKTNSKPTFSLEWRQYERGEVILKGDGYPRYDGFYKLKNEMSVSTAYAAHVKLSGPLSLKEMAKLATALTQYPSDSFRFHYSTEAALTNSNMTFANLYGLNNASGFRVYPDDKEPAHIEYEGLYYCRTVEGKRSRIQFSSLHQDDEAPLNLLYAGTSAEVFEGYYHTHEQRGVRLSIRAIKKLKQAFPNNLSLIGFYFGSFPERETRSSIYTQIGSNHNWPRSSTYHFYYHSDEVTISKYFNRNLKIRAAITNADDFFKANFKTYRHTHPQSRGGYTETQQRHPLSTWLRKTWTQNKAQRKLSKTLKLIRKTTTERNDHIFAYEGLIIARQALIFAKAHNWRKALPKLDLARIMLGKLLEARGHIAQTENGPIYQPGCLIDVPLRNRVKAQYINVLQALNTHGYQQQVGSDNAVAQEKYQDAYSKEKDFWAEVTSYNALIPLRKLTGHLSLSERRFNEFHAGKGRKGILAFLGTVSTAIIVLPFIGQLFTLPAMLATIATSQTAFALAIVGLITTALLGAKWLWYDNGALSHTPAQSGNATHATPDSSLSNNASQAYQSEAKKPNSKQDPVFKQQKQSGENLTSNADAETAGQSSNP